MNSEQKTLSSNQILFFGALVVTLSMGIRHGFGLWLQPITQAQEWSRETFSFAIAIQNLVWGFAGVFAGMLADRFGAFKVLIGGGILYALGLWGMAHSSSTLTFTLSTGVLIGRLWQLKRTRGLTLPFSINDDPHERYETRYLVGIPVQ